MGWDVEKSTNAILPLLNLASIGMVDLGKATDIVTDTMTPFQNELERLGKEAKASGKEFNDAKYMVDIFSQTIRKSNTNVELMGETMKYASSVTAQSGASFEDMATCIGMMANSAVKGSMAGTSLATGITRLLAPTEEAQAVMKKLNFEVVKGKDGSLNLGETVKKLQKCFSGLSKDAKTANAKIIFGQTALKGWIPLINASSESWESLANDIRNAEGATDEMMREIEKSGSYSFKILQSAISDFLIVVGDALAPALKAAAEKITEIYVKLSNWVEKMKETNPELLELIGKVALLAIVVPPLISIFGKLTGGLGKLFEGTAKSTKAFISFSKRAAQVAGDVYKVGGKVGFLTEGISTLVGALGGGPVIIGAVIAALTGLAIALGDNETALSWLQEKWGTFGMVVGGVCEFLNGLFSLTFGNLGHLLMAIGKTLAAIFTGDFWSIKGIWQDTWADIENTTAKAMSNIKLETTRSIQKMRNMTMEELSKVGEGFETVYGSLSGLTADTVDKVAKDLTSFVSSSSKGILDIMKGTSDSMAVLLEGIDTSKTQEEILKKLKANLESMARSGKYSADKLKSDFEDAFEAIQRNASDGAKRVGNQVDKITKNIGLLGQRTASEVAGSVHDIMSRMDDETYNTLKNMGGTWQQLFNGVEKGSLDSQAKLLKNLQAMGNDGRAIVDKLNKELQGAFDETGKKIEDSANGTQNSLKATSEAFSTMVQTIKDNSTTGVSAIADVFANGLSTLDVETIKSLRNTSDSWYSILDGTIDSSGKLVDNLSQQILWNLNWVAEQSPEKLEGFKTNLLQALVDANLITDGEMKALVETIDNATKDASEKSANTGEEIKDNITPDGASESLKQALDEANQTFIDKSSEIVNNSALAGEEAQKKFDEKVSNLGKDVQVDSNIINIEALGVQFQNAGTLAIQNFVIGWSNNAGLITEAINLGLSTISNDFSATIGLLNLAFDGVLQKIGLLNDTLNFTTEKINQINGVGFSPLENGVNNVKLRIGEVNVGVLEAKASLDNLCSTSVANLANGFFDANSKTKELKESVKGTSDEVQKLSGKNINNIIKQIVDLKEKTIKSKEELVRFLEKLDKLIAMSFKDILANLDSINSKIVSGQGYADTFKTKLQSLNNISFNTLISGLSSVNSWLSSVKSNANNASFAISNVSTKKPRSIEENGALLSGIDYYNSLLRSSTFDITKYQTRGGYYNSTSMAGTGKIAMELKTQREQNELMKQQIILLNQLLAATMGVSGDVNVNVQLDGYSLAKAGARYMNSEINKINKRKNRLMGRSE
ncbi:phage tail tape measure protein [Clostridium sp.]|uniref:phage tail tape measure protein n=1 Tax=Clostridium sp. TaxID=1506 RepID=UPI0025BCE94F|nr:phage tail tape measure protein [Clostridium sp.]